MRMRTAAVIVGLLSLISCALVEDERTPIGPANPSSVYCSKLGSNQLNPDGGPSLCLFADGGSCEAWSFFRAECGQPHSYCVRQGGQISNVKNDTSNYAVCTLDGGISCTESAYSTSGQCP